MNVSPLRNAPKSPVDDMERLKSAVNRTPEEKKLFQISDKLTKSAELGAEISSDWIVQRQNVDEYYTMTERREINNEEDEKNQLQIFNFFDEGNGETYKIDAEPTKFR